MFHRKDPLKVVYKHRETNQSCPSEQTGGYTVQCKITHSCVCNNVNCDKDFQNIKP